MTYKYSRCVVILLTRHSHENAQRCEDSAAQSFLKLPADVRLDAVIYVEALQLERNKTNGLITHEEFEERMAMVLSLSHRHTHTHRRTPACTHTQALARAHTHEPKRPHRRREIRGTHKDGARTLSLSRSQTHKHTNADTHTHTHIRACTHTHTRTHTHTHKIPGHRREAKGTHGDGA